VAFSRILTVDWSGAARGHPARLWTAEVRDGVVVRLANGRSREAVTSELVGLAAEALRLGERVLVGLDFAFGFPAWYQAARGWSAPAQAWHAFTPDTVDALLAAPVPPFWGRDPVRRRPASLQEGGDTPPLRDTERSLQPLARPFSVFQLVGAGAVGVGSLRGMSTLAALHHAGACLWPFDQDTGQPGLVVAEVWPRLAAGRVAKTDPAARRAAVAALTAAVACPRRALDDARASDDAFDALAAAAWLWARRRHLDPLPSDSTPRERREGRILGARTPALLAPLRPRLG
jgi:hypothetical protein